MMFQSACVAIPISAASAESSKADIFRVGTTRMHYEIVDCTNAYSNSVDVCTSVDELYSCQSHYTSYPMMRPFGPPHLRESQLCLELSDDISFSESQVQPVIGRFVFGRFRLLKSTEPLIADSS